jgi:hypothetical protein
VCVQRKLTSKEETEEETEEETYLSSRPAWVVDHNLCNLWSEGLDEESIPKEVRLTADALAQIGRLQAWAAVQVAELRKAGERQQSQPRSQPPQPQPQPRVPVVDATAAVSPVPALSGWPMVAPFQFDPAVIARREALKAAPRVGASPATVLDM